MFKIHVMKLEPFYYLEIKIYKEAYLKYVQ